MTMTEKTIAEIEGRPHGDTQYRNDFELVELTFDDKAPVLGIRSITRPQIIHGVRTVGNFDSETAYALGQKMIEWAASQEDL